MATKTSNKKATGRNTVVTRKDGTTLTGSAAASYGKSSGSSQAAPTNSSTGLSPALSANIAQANAQVASWKNPQGKNVITPDRLSSTPDLNIPTPPQPMDPGNLAIGNNTALAASPMMQQLGYTADGKGGFAPLPAQANDSVDQSAQRQLQNFLAGMGLREAPPNTADIYAQAEKEAGLNKARREVSNYTSQLNAIVAKSQADQLRLEGQGRGIPEVLIGGQQAQINREAAIAALPVQAQLAAAQGNLEMAQQHVDTMFKIKSQDALTSYQFKQKLVDSVMDFADKQEAQRLEALKLKDQRGWETQKMNLSTANQWAMQAIEYGQGGLAGRMMALDASSPTFAQDLAKLQGQVRKPVPVAAAPKRDTQVVDGKLIDMQTGEVISTIGGTPGGTLSGKPQTEGQAKANGFADRLKEAEATLKDSDKFGNFLALGGSLPNFAKSEDRQKFEQAQRNFINAVLRRESGAVISDQEFENAAQQYFPQRGDSDGVLAQKKANRNTVINSFYREASVLRPVAAGDIIESGGKRYKVDNDGVSLIEI